MAVLPFPIAGPTPKLTAAYLLSVNLRLHLP